MLTGDRYERRRTVNAERRAPNVSGTSCQATISVPPGQSPWNANRGSNAPPNGERRTPSAERFRHFVPGYDQPIPPGQALECQQRIDTNAPPPNGERRTLLLYGTEKINFPCTPPASSISWPRQTVWAESSPMFCTPTGHNLCASYKKVSSWSCWVYPGQVSLEP